jgi:hypothetical protein
MAIAISVGVVDEHLRGVAHHAVRGVFLTIAVVTLMCLALAVIVMLFNWPKFAVPPYMRDEPGLLTVRKPRRRIR